MSPLSDSPPEIRLVLMGKMASGKTYASNYLVQEHGATAWTVAERIKQVAHALVDQSGNLGNLLDVIIPDEGQRGEATYRLLQFADYYELEPGKPRRLYQEVGQILRDLAPSTQLCWEEDLERRIKSSPSLFTVIDVRSKEGYKFFCVDRSYTSVRIDAPLEIRKQRLLERDQHAVLDESVFHHQSETDVDELEFDFVISNAENNPQNFIQELEEVIKSMADTTSFKE